MQIFVFTIALSVLPVAMIYLRGRKASAKFSYDELLAAAGGWQPPRELVEGNLPRPVQLTSTGKVASIAAIAQLALFSVVALAILRAISDSAGIMLAGLILIFVVMMGAVFWNLFSFERWVVTLRSPHCRNCERIYRLRVSGHGSLSPNLPLNRPF